MNSAVIRIGTDRMIEIAQLPLVNSPDGGDRPTEQIKALRRSLAIEMGFVMSAVRIPDNAQIEPNGYTIKIKEVESGTGKISPGQYRSWIRPVLRCNCRASTPPNQLRIAGKPGST